MSPYPHHVVAMGYDTVPDGRDFTGASVDWSPPNQKKYSKYVCLSTDIGFTIALPYVTLETLLYTVEPPNNGQVGDEHFVHCSEVVPSSVVEMYGQYIGRGQTVCPL